AGVLSAYGMGLSAIGLVRERGIEQPLNYAIKSFLQAALSELEQQVCFELTQDVIGKILTKRHIHLRYEGSNSVLIVDFDLIQSMRRSFMEQHRRRFGFVASKKKLIVESISIESRIESVVPTEPHQTQRSSPRKKIPQLKIVKLFTDHALHNAAVYDRN